jgi:hypothetical protein
MKLQMLAYILLINNTIGSASEVVRPRLVQPRAVTIEPLVGIVASLVIAPPTFTLTAGNPEAGATGVASVSWDLSKGKPNKDWNLLVRADAASLANCPGVPLSALRVSCTSVQSVGSGNPTGSCSMSGTTLTTTDIMLARGNRGGREATFTVNVGLAFTDSWKYAASNSCSISITYTLNYDL